VRLSRGEEFQHLLGLYPMSNVEDEAGKPATPVVHPRVGYAYSASKVSSVYAMLASSSGGVCKSSLARPDSRGGCPHLVCF
jgi:hypothetical protein